MSPPEALRRRFGPWPGTALMLAALHVAVPRVTCATDAQPPDAGRLEEIIVTADRRPERALDVAASISVIGPEDLERMRATSLMDLAAGAPGFVIVSGGSPGQAMIVLRGLPALSSGTLVATLIDESAVGSSASWTGESVFALDMLPYDIERIEILRGPQGTLYGANSMGGVLKYVTRDPSLTSSTMQLGAEGFGIEGGGSLGVGARGSWSAPLIEDTLAVRGSLYVQETPGYIRNPLRGLNHENTLSQYGGRLATLWQPSTDLKVRLQVIYQRSDSAGDAILFAETLGTAQDPYYRPGGWLYGDLTYPHVVPEPFSSEVKFISAALDWHMTFAELLSVSTYSDKGVSSAQDYSQVFGYLLPILDPNTTSTLVRARFTGRTRKASQEIRLASPAGGRFVWQAGMYYDNERASNDQYLDALDARLDPIPALTPFFEAHIPSTYTEIAAFGTLTYRISDRFDMTGGGRWLTNSQTLEPVIVPNQIIPAGHTISHSAETPATYAFSARLHPWPEAMMYLRIASGYRPGTPNPAVPGYPEIPPQTHSDTMVNYEIGAKSEVMNRRASLDLAVFKINWSKLQLEVPTSDGNVTYTINAGRVTSEGFELAATYQPQAALQLAVNAAYTDAYATQAVPAAGILVGSRLPSSPRWTTAAVVDYRMPPLGQWTSRLSGTWRYIAPQYSGLSSAPPVGQTPGYSWMDLDVRATRGRCELSVYAKNLFDKRAFNSGGPATSSTTGANYFVGAVIQPRVVGVSATLNY